MPLLTAHNVTVLRRLAEGARAVSGITLHSAPSADLSHAYLVQPTADQRAYDDMTRGAGVVPIPSPLGHADEAGWSREAEALVQSWGFATTRRPGREHDRCFDVWPKAGEA